MVMTAERTIEAHIRSAARIEPERLPRLKVLGDGWAEAGARQFDFCACPVEIECTGVSSFPFAATSLLMENTVACAVLRSAKWHEIGFMLGDAGLADVFAEAMFGGNGVASQPAAPRPLTTLDRRLVEKGFAAFTQAGNPVFAAIAPLDVAPDLCLFADIPDELDDLLDAGNRNFVLLAFKVSVGQVAGAVHVAIPEKAFAPHRRKLSVVPQEAPPPSDAVWAKEMQDGLQLADLEVRALLDERQIALGAVAQFALGQTIVLDATTESLLVIECEGQRLFRGRMGMSRDAYVVRIEDRIDPTEEFIDDILAD